MGITLFAGAVQAANAYGIAENGGFETGDTTGWTVFGCGTVSAVSPSSGTYSGQGNCIGGPCDVLFKNADYGIGIAQAGGSIAINFDYRGEQLNGGVSFAELFSELDGGGVTATELLFGAPI